MLKLEGHDLVAIVIVIIMGVLIALGHDQALVDTTCAIALAFLAHGGYTKLKGK